MFPSHLHIIRKGCWRRWACWFALVLCVSVSGCTSLNRFRGEGFRDNEMSDWAGQFRGEARDTESFAFSNKARQIEQNLGAGK